MRSWLSQEFVAHTQYRTLWLIGVVVFIFCIPYFASADVADVTAEYLACPTSADIAQFNNDFNFVWPDYRTPGWSAWSTSTVWNDYPYVCDFTSTGPSRLAVYNKLRFLRDIRFSRPLPFTGGVSIYDYLTLKGYLNNGPGVPSYVLIASSSKPQILLGLDCSSSNSGNRAGSYPNSYINIWLGMGFSRLPPYNQFCPLSASSSSPGFVDPYFITDDIYNPIHQVSLLVHETHHAIAFVGHTLNATNDLTIDEVGAWAAEFYFDAWVALYSTNVDNATKTLARLEARGALGRIGNKCPTNLELRAVVNNISPGLCLINHPDLYPNFFKLLPTTLRAGFPLTIEATIRNQGASETSSTLTQLRIDQGNDGTWDVVSPTITRPLPTNGSNKVRWSWVPPVGTHTIEVCADATKVLNEANTKNNCVSNTFVVGYASPTGTLPDLYVSQMRIYPLLIRQTGRVLSALVQVQNQGGAQSTSSTLDLSLDTQSGGNGDVSQTQSVSPLLPGGRETHRFSNIFLPTTPGPYRLRVCVNTNNTVSESDNTNNCVENIFIVTGTPLSSATLSLPAPISVPQTSPTTRTFSDRSALANLLTALQTLILQLQNVLLNNK